MHNGTKALIAVIAVGIVMILFGIIEQSKRLVDLHTDLKSISSTDSQLHDDLVNLHNDLEHLRSISEEEIKTLRPLKKYLPGPVDQYDKK